jgi:N-hydroxyarylamine O-acetyltransferase
MDAFDLDAYLRRIGHAGPVAPDLRTLAALVACHREAIAFENFDGLAGRVPALDLASLQAKLVHGRRGGLCFEQNGLLRAALARIGFDVATLEGRVRTGPSHDTPRTHVALRVAVAGAPVLADVGFGALSPGVPLPLGGREPVVHEGESWCLADAEPDADGRVDGWIVRSVSDRHWHDVYRLHAAPVGAVDEAMANWFVATSPEAMLRRNLVVSRPLAGGARLALLNDRLTVRRAGMRTERRHLACRAEFVDVLADGFGLDVPPAALDAALAVVERAGAGQDPDATKRPSR